MLSDLPGRKSKEKTKTKFWDSQAENLFPDSLIAALDRERVC